MRHSLSTLALTSIYCLSLTACASAPKASTLMTGISPVEAAKTFPVGQMRQANDPVCVNFYKNAQTYITKANQPSAGGNFVKAVGISVLAGVVTGGVANSGITSNVGRIAAQRAASTAVYQGSNLALAGLNKKTGPGSKVIAAAEQLKCPVDFGP